MNLHRLVYTLAIIVANNAIGLIKNTLGNLGVMDMNGAFDRIDTMNRFQKTVSIMTGDSNKANVALEALKDTTLGTAYGLDVASKATQGFLTRGMSIGAATNQVRIWADAVSFYGEGTNEQLSSVVDAIGKMYSKCTVEADQLDRLFDAGIGAAEIYAKAVGQSVSEVKENLSEGEISAAQFIQTVSDALDKGVSAGAAKDAGATWAATFDNVSAAIKRGWTNVITNLDNELAARGLPSTMEMVTAFGQKVESVLNTVGNSMGFMVDCVMNVCNVISSVGGFVVDNWSIIEPIIWGVVTAVVAFKLAHACMSLIAFLVNTVAAYRIEASEVTAAKIAQWGLNAAMKAFSSIAIVALIGAIVAGLVYVNNEFGSLEITLLVFKQIFMTMWENFLYKLTLVEVGVAKFVAKFNVAFYSVGQAIDVIMSSMSADVLTIIQDMVNGAIDLINSLINTVNKIPGVSIETVQQVSFGTEAQIEAEARRQAAKNNIDSYAQQQQANVDAVQKWSDDYYNKIIKNQADREAAIDEAMAKQVERKAKKQEDTHNNADKYNDILGNTAVNTGDTAKNTAKVADAVTATSEDLKYLRELAETDYIIRFTTAEITVTQTNHNTINNEMDLDGVTEHLRSTMEEQMFAAAEGVH
ncbi:MAG: tape measure protein [Lachnospiraceae bacterium]|nr:tape measure protein [Lachnospiraceae bacterium]